MRIAIVGSGVSGLVAAHRLKHRHEVVLFEGAARVGGHTNTVVAMERERPIPIDTGFIVFNTKTYPNFAGLLAELGVAWAPSDMSFSVRSERRDFEYNARSLDTLFAQRRRLVSPRHWRMVADILRFFREARALIDADAEVPLMTWLVERGYSPAFIDDHLMPLLRAVWSAKREVAEAFPARFFVRFFENHGFLEVEDREPWLTIPGGAHSYVRAILARFRGELRTSARVQRLVRQAAGVRVHVEGSPPEVFDHVIVAAHSDQALAMVENPTDPEREILAAIPYQRNEAVLHTDERLMPRQKKTWASWNVHLDDDGIDGACVTYWMNALQPLGAERDYFVTLNNSSAIDPEQIITKKSYAHPIFTLEGVAAQARHEELIDHRGISYCGAYWGNGFHEDGVVSATRVVERLNARSAVEVAA